MIQEINIKVTNLIDNVYNFYQVTNDIISYKNQKLFDFCTHEFAIDRGRARPYPGVISGMVVSKVNVGEEDIIGDEATVKANFLVSHYVHRDVEYYNSLIKYFIVVKLIYSEKYEEWYVDDLTEDYEVQKSSYDEGISVINTEPIDNAVKMIQDNIDNFDNINYMFKGKTSNNPLFLDDNYYVDSFNLIYWILYTNGVDVNYRFGLDYLLSSTTFDTIFNKGYKYETMKEEFRQGDILFFNKNDSFIGLYLGDNQFFSILGEFLKDDTHPKIFSLDDYWDKFNGRVLRVKIKDYLEEDTEEGE